MRRASIVSVVTIAAFLATGPLHLASAQTAAAAPSPLRASIDREAARAAQLPTAPARRDPRVRKSMMQGGGGGGTMVIMLVSTLAGLAATYFVVKELQKKTDEASAQ